MTFSKKHRITLTFDSKCEVEILKEILDEYKKEGSYSEIVSKSLILADEFHLSLNAKYHERFMGLIRMVSPGIESSMVIDENGELKLLPEALIEYITTRNILEPTEVVNFLCNQERDKVKEDANTSDVDTIRMKDLSYFLKNARICLRVMASDNLVYWFETFNEKGDLSGARNLFDRLTFSKTFEINGAYYKKSGKIVNLKIDSADLMSEIRRALMSTCYSIPDLVSLIKLGQVRGVNIEVRIPKPSNFFRRNFPRLFKPYPETIKWDKIIRTSICL